MTFGIFPYLVLTGAVCKKYKKPTFLPIFSDFLKEFAILGMFHLTENAFKKSKEKKIDKIFFRITDPDF